MTTNRTSKSDIPSFSDDNQVELVGLQKSPKLNHRVGFVVGEIMDNGRYAVALYESETLDKSKKRAIKPENMQLYDSIPSICFGCDDIFSHNGLRVCEKCQYAQYCSRECQLDHWHKEHKNKCKTYQEGRLARHDETKLPTEDPQERLAMRVSRAARWFQKAKYANAEAEYKAIIKENLTSDLIPIYQKLGFAMIKQNQQNPGTGKRMLEIIALMKKTVKLPLRVPTRDTRIIVETNRLLGDFLLLVKDLDGAEQAYKEALKLGCDNDSHSADARVALQRIELARTFVARGGTLEELHRDRKEQENNY